MSDPDGVPVPKTAAATKAAAQKHADRAIDDPAKLAYAKRVVRTALSHERLSLADLVCPEVDERIRADVEAAPPLPADLEDRLNELIRASVSTWGGAAT